MTDYRRMCEVLEWYMISCFTYYMQGVWFQMIYIKQTCFIFPHCCSVSNDNSVVV